MSELLDVNGLSVRRGATEVLSDFNLTVQQGETVAVLGASGSGKTTLLLAITALLESSARVSGRIRYCGRELNGVLPHRRGIPLVLQDLGLFEHLTVRDNVAYPLRLADVAPAEAMGRATDALSALGLNDYLSVFPQLLSGGQRQRVALARVLVTGAPLVLLDEPTSALDAETAARFVELVSAMREYRSVALLIATHDRALTSRIVDRIAILDAGRVVQCAVPADIHRRPVSTTVARLLGHTNILPCEGLTARFRSLVQITPEEESRAVFLPEDRCRFTTDAEDGCSLSCRVNGVMWRDSGPFLEVSLESGYRLLAALQQEVPERGTAGFLSIDEDSIHILEDTR